MKKQVHEFVLEGMKEYFPSFSQEAAEPPSDDWDRDFKERNKFKSLPETSMEDKRIQNATTSVIGKWFDEVYTHEISSKFHPAMVANMDETMLTTNHRLLCVVRRDSSYAITSEQEDQEHITIL